MQCIMRRSAALIARTMYLLQPFKSIVRSPAQYFPPLRGQTACSGLQTGRLDRQSIVHLQTPLGTTTYNSLEPTAQQRAAHP